MPGRGRKRTLASRRAELTRNFRRTFGLKDREESVDSSQDGGIVIQTDNPQSIAPVTHSENEARHDTTEANASPSEVVERGPQTRAEIIAAFKDTLKSGDHYSSDVRKLFRQLFDPPHTRGYNWRKHAGDWAPFESQFAYGLVRLFLATTWSKRQWNLFRVFLIWMISHCVRGSSAEVREYKAMMSLTGCLPGVGFASRVSKRFWRADNRVQSSKGLRLTETRTLSQRDHAQEKVSSQASSRSENCTDRRVMKEHTAEFFVHNLEVHLILQLMLPGARESVQNTPAQLKTGPITGVVESVACMRRDLLLDKYVVIRDRPSLLILREGCCIRNPSLRRAAIITSLKWEQPAEYISVRNRGLLPKEADKWSLIHDRRPYVRIQMAFFVEQVTTDTTGSDRRYSFVKKKYTVRFGAVKGRVSTSELGIQDRTWFRGWKCDDNAGLKRSQVVQQQLDLSSQPSPIGERYPRRLIKIWAQRRIYVQRLRQCAERTNDCTMHCSVGWDAFSTTQFGSKHRGAVGYYVHVLNVTPKMPTICFSVTDKSVPASCVIPELWKQMNNLQRLRETLLHDCNANGSQTLCVRNFRALLTAVCLDKEMLDPFHLSAASSERVENQSTLISGCAWRSMCGRSAN